MSNLPLALERSDIETVVIWMPFFVGGQDAESAHPAELIDESLK
ncbi:hypothetical protein [Novipirellula herctigrandis]